MTISRFKGEQHGFLSSMEPLRNGVATRDGIVVDSLEIGYQADKFPPGEARDRVLGMPNGYAAKSIANKLVKNGEAEEVEGWYDLGKLQTMRWYVRQKFGRNPDVAQLLADTGDQTLVEGNRRDDFWGACPSGEPGILVGRNELGLLLMDTRQLLTEGVDLIALAKSDVSPMTTHEVRSWQID